MTNNNHRTKSKRIQCKDVSTLALLRFVALWTDKKSSVTLFKLDDEPSSVWQIMLPMIPMCVMKQKFENMVRKGLVHGCYCGCRGDFTITKRGRDRIRKLEEYQVKVAREFLETFYDLAGPGILGSRPVVVSIDSAIEDLMDKGQLTAIDALLQYADFSRFSVRMSLTLLRSPRRVVDYLDNWLPAFTRFDQHLKTQYPRRRDALIVGFAQSLYTPTFHEQYKPTYVRRVHRPGR